MTENKQSSFKKQSAQQLKDEAFRLAKHIQIPEQTKQQTKLIAKGIEKGIALYKNQERIKEKNKRKAQKKRQAQMNADNNIAGQKTVSNQQTNALGALKSIRAALIVTGIILTGISILHILRYFVDLELIIGGFSVPLIWSIPSAAVSAALAGWLFLSSRTIG